MIRRFPSTSSGQALWTLLRTGLDALRRLWPLFVWRSKYERDIAGLQERLEQERARVRALQWWRGGLG